MEPVLIDAYLRCRGQFGCSVDALLCSPEQRGAFLAYARQALGEAPEEELLRGLVNLRKRSKLPTDKGGGVAVAGAGR